MREVTTTILKDICGVTLKALDLFKIDIQNKFNISELFRELYSDYEDFLLDRGGPSIDDFDLGRLDIMEASLRKEYQRSIPTFKLAGVKLVDYTQKVINEGYDNKSHTLTLHDDNIELVQNMVFNCYEYNILCEEVFLPLIKFTEKGREQFREWLKGLNPAPKINGELWFHPIEWGTEFGDRLCKCESAADYTKIFLKSFKETRKRLNNY